MGRRKGRQQLRERGPEGNVEDGSVVGGGEGREGGKGRRRGSMSCLADSNLTAIREGRVRDLLAWGGGGGAVMFWGGGVMVALG